MMATGPPQREDPDERELVRRYLAGDRTAFASLVAMHQRRLMRLAFRLLGWSPDAAEVEDVVQEVFITAMRHLSRFRWESSLGTWLATLTINQCRRLRRRRLLGLQLLRRLRHGRRRDETGVPAANESLADSERDEQVRWAVRNLPMRYREVMVLRYLEEIQIDEVARILGLSRSAVEVRLHRARHMLEDTLRNLMDER